MYQRYFDCSSQYDQVRFTETQEKLAQYAAENFSTFGTQFKTMIMDLKTVPTVDKYEVPMKEDPKDSSKMIRKPDDELDWVEKEVTRAEIKAYVEKKDKLKSEKLRLYTFIFNRCTELLQD